MSLRIYSATKAPDDEGTHIGEGTDDAPRNVGRWYHEQIDPTGDTIADIVAALRKIEPSAAEEFISLYLGKSLEDEESG